MTPNRRAWLLVEGQYDLVTYREETEKMVDPAKKSWLRLDLAAGIGLMIIVTAAAVYLLATGTAQGGASVALGVVVVSGLIFIVFGRLHRKQSNL